MTHAVIIPLFNKAGYIVKTLESLMLQTKMPDELIIVDDQSTDGSLEIAKDFLEKQSFSFRNCRIEIVSLQENYGPGNARNTGFLKTNSELISFLDADDLYHPHLLEVASQAFEKEGLEFLVLNMMFLPGGEVYPNLTALKKYLQPLSENLYEVIHPLKAVTSPRFIMGVGSNVITKRRWLTSVQYKTGSYLNEGIDFWYRVLKHILDRTAIGKVALLSGNYLQVTEVNGSLSRKTYAHFKEIDFPPVLSRYKNSKDHHDRLLMGMIGRRWYTYSIRSLKSPKQKMLFIGHYSYLLPKYIGYTLRRLLS